MLDKSNKPHVTILTLEAYLDNTLPPEQKTAVQAHLQNCPQCQQWLAQEDELTQQLVYAPRPQYRLPQAKAAQIQKNLYQKLRRERMMNNIRVTLRAAAVLVTLMVVVGGFFWWQNRQATADEAEPTAVATPIPNDQTQTTITFAAPGRREAGYMARIEQFEGLHPEINVQFVRIEDLGAENMDAFLAGSEDAVRDVRSLVDTSEVNHINVGGDFDFLSLEPLRDANATFNSDDFWPGTLDACQSNGQLIGLPVLVNLTLIFYNPDLFSEAGVNPPSLGWTWTDFLAAAQATAQPDDGAGRRYGFVSPQFWLDGSSSVKLLIPFVATNAGTGSKALAASLAPLTDAYAALIAEGDIRVPEDYQLFVNLINDEQAAMWLETLETYNYRQKFVSNVQIAPVPQVEGVNSTMVDVKCLAINSESTQPDVAWTWLNFLTHNPPLDSGLLPARPTATESDSYWQSRPGEESAVRYAVEHAFYDTQAPILTTVLPLLDRAMLDVLNQAMLDGTDLTGVLPADLPTEP